MEWTGVQWTPLKSANKTDSGQVQHLRIYFLFIYLFFIIFQVHSCHFLPLDHILGKIPVSSWSRDTTYIMWPVRQLKEDGASLAGWSIHTMRRPHTSQNTRWWLSLWAPPLQWWQQQHGAAQQCVPACRCSVTCATNIDGPYEDQ